MYETVLSQTGAQTAVREEVKEFFAFAGISRSTGNRMWLCGDDKATVEKIVLLLKKTELSDDTDVILLDEVLNRRQGVFLVSPTDGIGSAARGQNGGLVLESRGSTIIVQATNEFFIGTFEGL